VANLGHVYWIGGGSRAGKSTVARRLAVKYGFQIYDTDAAMRSHSQRPSAHSHPLLTRFLAMDMDERWLTRSPDVMFETFPWFHGECFEMIVHDLVSMPTDPPIVAEGFRLLPDLVQPLLSSPNQAIWLLPTPAFREAVIAEKGGWEFLARTSDPKVAVHNLLERDRIFTIHLANGTARLGLPTLPIDLATTEEDVAQRVIRQLKV
jgi:hypothetical protein